MKVFGRKGNFHPWGFGVRVLLGVTGGILSHRSPTPGGQAVKKLWLVWKPQAQLYAGFRWGRSRSCSRLLWTLRWAGRDPLPEAPGLAFWVIPPSGRPLTALGTHPRWLPSRGCRAFEIGSCISYPRLKILRGFLPTTGLLAGPVKSGPCSGRQWV